jgi:AcrR family transcriptional regulator
VAFTENGIEHTSMQAVARRADVAAGTVLYHFPDADALAKAVVRWLLDTIDIPRVDAIPVRAGRVEKARVAVGLIYAFYERTGELFHFYRANKDHPAIRDGVAEFERALWDLIDRGVGGSTLSPATVAAVWAVADASFYGCLLRGGLTTAEATDIAETLIAALVEHAQPGA